MEIIAEFQDESICNNLRTRRKPYLIPMVIFKYPHEDIAQKCNVEKKRGIKKRGQIVDRRFFINLVNPKKRKIKKRRHFGKAIFGTQTVFGRKMIYIRLFLTNKNEKYRRISRRIDLRQS